MPKLQCPSQSQDFSLQSLVWGGVTLQEPPQELPLPCSAPGVDGEEETQTGLRSSAHLPTPGSAMLSWRGCVAGFSLTAPGAQPLVFVIVSLCGSNNNFIFNRASPQREFAQLMYISALCKDILDSHEF